MNSQTAVSAPTLISFLPLILMSGILAFFIYRLAKRKGRSGALFLLGFIPLANIMTALWLASLTDRAVLEQLEELKRRNT